MSRSFFLFAPFLTIVSVSFIKGEKLLPVLGHAFVGLALGIWTRPTPHITTSSSITVMQRTVWTPLVIGLSYLPDVLAQLALLFGAIDARQITHALPSALVMSLAATQVLPRIVGTSVRRTFVVTFIAIALHDVLDVLQATDRMLWWPLSYRAVGQGESLLPTTPLKEAVSFGFPCLLAILIRYIATPNQSSTADALPNSHAAVYDRYRWWVNIAATASLLGAAAITQHLRQVRDDQLEQARQESQEHHKYSEALALLDAAEQWPSTAKPGRIDYLRGWTYSQMGERKQAEEYYLRSLRADPNYFWAVADFALFYASAPEESEVRQQRVAPYLRRLQEGFMDHPQLPETLAAITQALRASEIASPVKNSPPNTLLLEDK